MPSSLTSSHLCSAVLSKHGWLWPFIRRRHRVNWWLWCWLGRRGRHKAVYVSLLLFDWFRFDFLEIQETKFSFHFVHKSWISCLFGYMLQTLVVKDTFLTILEFHKLLLFEISNSSFHGRNKHIKVQYYFVLELVASQIIRLDYCSTILINSLHMSM